MGQVLVNWVADDRFGFGDNVGVPSGTTGRAPTIRPFLPVVLALVVLRGSLLPWVTIREFSDKKYTYNLTDVRGGIGIIMTIVLFVMVGGLISMFKRLTGLTVISIAVAMLGWMAAISGILLTLVASFLPSIRVAGLDLTRATVSQGSGVAVTVIASLSLAFLVVRQFEPLNRYSAQNKISLLPLVALVPLVVTAVGMHAEWMRLGREGESVEAVIAGDSLYGSGIVVLVLWMTIGLWICALVLQRTVAMRVAGVASIVVSIVVVMYATFLWLGGKALWWLLPQKVESWASISFRPMLFVILAASVGLFVCGISSFLESVSSLGVVMSEQRTVASRSFHTSDLAASLLFGALVLSLIVPAAL